MESRDLENRFAYHAPKDDKARAAHEYVRMLCGDLANTLNELLAESREKSVAITKLEEVMFWANASIARPALPVGVEIEQGNYALEMRGDKIIGVSIVDKGWTGSPIDPDVSPL